MSVETLTSHKHLPELGVHATSLIVSGTVRLGSSIKQEILEAQAFMKGPFLLSLGLCEPGNWYLLQARDPVFGIAPNSRRFSPLSLYKIIGNDRDPAQGRLSKRLITRSDTLSWT